MRMRGSIDLVAGAGSVVKFMKSSFGATGISAGTAALTITWSDGTVSEFASLWLRDNIPEDRDRFSGQRLVDVADLPVNPRIRSARLDDALLCVDWEEESRSSAFPLSWLYGAARPAAPRPELQLRRWLNASNLTPAGDFGFVQYPILQSNSAVRLGWLTRLLQDGIAFLTQVPRTHHAILEAMRYVGYVPETNYGRVFDVRAVPQPENLAFSDLGLGLHTDNPYREPVPGFQALHALIASPDGGDSLFADGFALAEHFRATETAAFEILTRTPVPFHYQAAGVDLYAERPLIELSCNGSVAAVSYNNRSIQPLRLGPDDCARFYPAYRKFAELLRDPSRQMRVHINSGDLVVFDNRRVLHGRTSFTSARHPRHLQGCYLTRDSVYSEAAVLRRELDSAASA